MPQSTSTSERGGFDRVIRDLLGSEHVRPVAQLHRSAAQLLNESIRTGQRGGIDSTGRIVGARCTRCGLAVLVLVLAALLVLVEELLHHRVEVGTVELLGGELTEPTLGVGRHVELDRLVSTIAASAGRVAVGGVLGRVIRVVGGGVGVGRVERIIGINHGTSSAFKAQRVAQYTTGLFPRVFIAGVDPPAVYGYRADHARFGRVGW